MIRGSNGWLIPGDKAYQKTLVFAILRELDSLYYYLNKVNDNFFAFYPKGSIEIDPYRKEEGYKAFLKK